MPTHTPSRLSICRQQTGLTVLSPVLCGHVHGMCRQRKGFKGEEGVCKHLDFLLAPVAAVAVKRKFNPFAYFFKVWLRNVCMQGVSFLLSWFIERASLVYDDLQKKGFKSAFCGLLVALDLIIRMDCAYCARKQLPCGLRINRQLEKLWSRLTANVS